MSKFKTDWNYGDTISPEDINRWEEYLQNISENKFYNTTSISADDGSANTGDFGEAGNYLIVPTDEIKIKDMPAFFNLSIPCVMNVTKAQKGDITYTIQKITSFDGKKAMRGTDNAHSFGEWLYSGIVKTIKEAGYEVNVIALQGKYMVDVYIDSVAVEFSNKQVYGKVLGNIGFTVKEEKTINIVTPEVINTTANIPQYIICSVLNTGAVRVARINSQAAIGPLHFSLVVEKE
mgnify:CR=1 FL=1